MKTWKEYHNLARSENLCGKELSEDYPQEIREWLAGICLLEGIPMQYLLPDARMLPMNGVRFFHIDRMWLQAMTDGALSLGRITELDRAMDGMTGISPIRSAAGCFRSRRQKRMHRNHRRVSDEDLKTSDDGSELTGFLLRSELVRCWKGIEVKGYSSDSGQEEQKLAILRLEKLSDEVMICIFDGEAARIELLEPAEALHFGTKADDRKIRIRKVRGKDVGKTLGETTLPVEESGRLDVEAFVQELNEKLDFSPGEKATSAELALQLICTADMCEIRQEEVQKWVTDVRRR